MSDTSPVTTNVDASKVLQDLFGLSQMASQMQIAISALVGQMKAFAISDEFKATFTTVIADGAVSGIKKLLADETYFGLLINVIGDSLIHFATQVLKDPDLEDEAFKFGQRLIADDAAKGALADAVYHGTKRLTEDGEAQKALATVANMIVCSQAFTNVIDRAINTINERNKELVTNPKLIEVLTNQRDQLIAKLQDVINLSLSESAQDLKNLRLTLSLNATQA